MNSVKLIEYLDGITKGTTPTTIGGSFLNEGVNFVKAECLNTGRIIDKSSLSYVSSEIHNKLNRSILNEGDLLFSIAGHLGKMAIVRKNDLPANTNQAVAILRIDQKKADIEFLYYYLCSKHVSEYISSQCAQSVQPNLNLAQIGELPIIEYPLFYQHKIASVLSALDSKIELNNRINAELEAMAKTLYDYWFVQFDFPDKNGKPYKSAGGKMVWNEELKREIPEGWEVKPLGKAINIIRGSSPRPIEDFLSHKGMPWVKISDATKSDSRFIIETKQFIIEEGVPNGRSVYPNTLILSNSASPAIPRIMKINASVHDGWLVIDKYSGGLTPEFMFHYFEYERPRIICLGSGSIFKNLKTDYLKDLKFIQPSKTVLDELSPQFKSISETIYSKTIENQKLTELRDWLLPMLMIGQVKVN